MDTSELGLVIFFGGLAALVILPCFWLTIRTTKKAVRIFRSFEIETSENRRTSVIVATLFVLSVLLAWKALFEDNIKFVGNGAVSTDWQWGLGAFVCLVIAMSLGFVMHPLRKPTPSFLSRFDRFWFIRWPRHHKIVSAILGLILLATGIYAYQLAAMELNKRAFVQARATIDTVYADIVKNVGSPTAYNKKDYCSESYFGPYELKISCNVYTDLAYKVEDRQEANQLTARINDIVKKYPKRLEPTSAPKSDIYTNFAPSSTPSNTEPLFNYYKFKGGLLCIFEYKYETPEETNPQPGSTKSSRVLHATIDCSGEAFERYYPLLASS